jgi:hypothetical protein
VRDIFTGLNIDPKISIHPQGEEIDGTYLVTRADLLSSLARSLFGPSYGGNLRLRVNLGEVTWITGGRGDTVYTVKNGRVIEIVNLPLLAVGRLDRRISRLTRT